jgi:hypothetical protein
MMKFKKGDTIVEVMFAFAIFCMVAIIGLTLMNMGIQTAQTSLELTIARNEVSTQAEALRFIHNSYVSELNLSSSSSRIYTKAWKGMINPAKIDTQAPPLNNAASSCQYDPAANKSRPTGAFVVNTRNLIPDGAGNVNALEFEKFEIADIFPRILFLNEADSNAIDYSSFNTDIHKVQGIWIKAVANTFNDKDNPFYDFHIRACWFSPGKSVPTTIGTIVRLYNPECTGGSTCSE